MVGVKTADAGGLAPLVDGRQADAQGGQLGGAERGRLDHLRAEDLDPQQIGLDLHQEIVGGGAPVDAQVVDRRPASACIAVTRSTFCSAIASSNTAWSPGTVLLI